MIRRTRLQLLVTAALFSQGCAPAPSPGQSPGVVSSEHAVPIARGRSIVRPLVQRGSGVAVAVAIDGRIVWSEGFGHTSRERTVAVSRAARFRLYSLMKPVTAVLALQAAARGEVGLNDPVRNVLPALPAHYDRVTLTQLLAHRAGVRHYRDVVEASSSVACARASEALPLFIEDSLVATPGSEESYSSWGFVLASAVLERAAGMSFDSLFATRLRMPAGMIHTARDTPADSTDRVSHYDVDSTGAVRRTPRLDNSCKMGGGGYIGSAEDVARFYMAVLGETLVPMRAVRQLLGGRDVFTAGGSGPGGEAVALADLNARMAVVILSNTGGLEQRIALARARELLHAVFEPTP